MYQVKFTMKQKKIPLSHKEHKEKTLGLPCLCGILKQNTLNLTLVIIRVINITSMQG